MEQPNDPSSTKNDNNKNDNTSNEISINIPPTNMNTTTTTNTNTNTTTNVNTNTTTNTDDSKTTTNEENEDDSSYEYIQGQRICIIIDSDESTNRALNKALETFDKEKDELYLLAVTSSLDYLNDEKNDAKLTLYKYEHYFDSIGIQYTPIQVESISITSKIISELEENEIDLAYVGAQALTNVSNPDNIIFSAFSLIKQVFLGTIVSGLKSASEKKDCKWKLEIVN
ncbi:hypothetical protein RB653_004436 [Dictyostelium firmibasis]|uniref:Uncharacterized protein n=1 Tax=Dictyostelium firmibasis TaxID=79012 RepID=A0AAN7Z036_9MYCE